MSIDPPFVVELFGQPGSGKSTLARSAAAGSGLIGRSSMGAAWKRQPRLVKATFLARAMLDRAGLACAIKVAIGARLFRGDSLVRLVRLLIKSHWFRSQAGRYLLEEGHLQDLWSTLYSAGRTDPDPHMLAPLIRCLYRGLDAQIAFLDAEADELFNRIRRRTHGKSRLDRLAELELRQHLLATEHLALRIVDAAKMAGLRVERVDASLPIEAMVDQLRGAMPRLSSPLAANG